MSIASLLFLSFKILLLSMALLQVIIHSRHSVLKHIKFVLKYLNISMYKCFPLAE